MNTIERSRRWRLLLGNTANLTPEQKATLIAQTGMAESRGNAAAIG